MRKNMSKKVHYLLLMILLMASTGCETVKGAANGLGQDVHNLSNPDKNGWNALKKADDWVQKNVW
jgi:predicted small secreted protein